MHPDLTAESLLQHGVDAVLIQEELGLDQRWYAHQGKR